MFHETKKLLSTLAVLRTSSFSYCLLRGMGLLVLGFVCHAQIQSSASAAPLKKATCDALLETKVRIDRNQFNPALKQQLPIYFPAAGSLYQTIQCFHQQGRWQDAESELEQAQKQFPDLQLLWQALSIQNKLSSQKKPHITEAFRLLKDLLQQPSAAPLLRSILFSLKKTNLGRTQQSANRLYLQSVVHYFQHRTKIESADMPLLMDAIRLANAKTEPILTAQLHFWVWRKPLYAKHARMYAALPNKLRQYRLPTPTAEDYVTRAATLYRLRQYTLLVKEVESLSKQKKLAAFPRTQRTALGDRYFQALLRRRINQSTFNKKYAPQLNRWFLMTEPQQWTWQIRFALRARSISEAEKMLNKLETEHPDAEALPSLYQQLVNSYARLRQPQTQLRWGRQLIARYPKSSQAIEMHWVLGWQQYQQQKMANAIRWFDAALHDPTVLHPVTEGRLIYWKGRALIQLKKTGETREMWEAFIEKRAYGYYSLLMRMLLDGELQVKIRPIAKTYQVPDLPLVNDVGTLWSQPPFLVAVFLWTVDEQEVATGLLANVIKRPLPGGIVDEIGNMLQYTKNGNLLVKLSVRHAIGALRNTQIVTVPLWHRAYPLAHWEISKAHIPHFDPLFAQAIMREESHFQADALSSAGARGLMQLMPATAKIVAKQISKKEKKRFAPNLYEPSDNIRLGSEYLGQLLKRFNQSLVLAAAAYNAGPTRVKQWLNQRGKLPVDEFIETIPFTETRNYVKRVYLGYWIYRSLYVRQPAHADIYR